MKAKTLPPSARGQKHVVPCKKPQARDVSSTRQGHKHTTRRKKNKKHMVAKEKRFSRRLNKTQRRQCRAQSWLQADRLHKIVLLTLVYYYSEETPTYTPSRGHTTPCHARSEYNTHLDNTRVSTKRSISQLRLITIFTDKIPHAAYLLS